MRPRSGELRRALNSAADAGNLSLSINENFERAIREQITGELRTPVARNLNTRKTGANADGATLSADSATTRAPHFAN